MFGIHNIDGGPKSIAIFSSKVIKVFYKNLIRFIDNIHCVLNIAFVHDSD